jgi:hypothetical protein
MHGHANIFSRYLIPTDCYGNFYVLTMYTVIRFHISGASISVEELGAQLTALGLNYDGPDRTRYLRVSCTLARDETWPEHISMVRAQVQALSGLLRHVRERGGGASIDIAIDPDDFQGPVGSFEFPDAVMRTLLEEKVSVVFSVYR